MPEVKPGPGAVNKGELEERLIAKACKDEKFRTDLTNDPKGTIARELQINIPDSIKIHIHQETATEFHLVLPALTPPEELTDVELQDVVGATDGSACRCVGGVRG